jgi:23S rRNA (uracil1939-C5)-methyltransferase
MTRRRSDPGVGRTLEVEIAELGAAGDGLAPTPEGMVYVPLTLPGERWRVRLARPLGQGWQAEPLACLRSAERAPPVCPHFGRCGGCRLQHLPPALYAEHKRRRIVQALAHRGLPGETVVTTVQTTPPASRRRLRLGLARINGRPGLGFRARGSHRLEPVAACPVALPELAAALPALADGLGAALSAPEPAELDLTAAEGGLDLVLWASRAVTLAERERLAALAETLDLARLSWAETDEATPEPIVARRPVTVALGRAQVVVPPGAFLQATRFGERCLQEAVIAWGAGAARAVDLFAGLGTLTFALAETAAAVRAVEGDPMLAEALRGAAAGIGAGRKVTVEVRDLARRPLAAAELKGVDLVVLDPPRAGAQAQAQALATAEVPQVIYASCHPESFARDARRLVDGGYALLEVRPVDQFLYAAEVELAARFARPEAAGVKRA